MVEVGPTTITQDRLKRRWEDLHPRRGGWAWSGWSSPAIGYGVGDAERPLILAAYLVAFAYWLGIAIARQHLVRHLPRLQRRAG